MLAMGRLHRAWQRRAAKWFAQRRILVDPIRPIISFTFDDFPESALTVGGTILESAGARGTYYTSLGLAGQITPTGKMFNLEQLSDLIARGHELGCHTYDHCPAWETDAREFEASVERNSAALQILLPTNRYKTLSYPISYPRPATKRRMAPRFPACRGGGQTFNRGVTDANYLQSFFIEQARDNLDCIKTAIDDCVNQHGWLIFSTHDVTQAPTRYGCTPAQFAEIVRYCSAAGAQILPVSLALRATTQPNS